MFTFLYSSFMELLCSHLSLVWARYSRAMVQVAATRNIWNDIIGQNEK